MFSGIIESLGRVVGLDHQPHSLVLDIESDLTNVAEGESIALNGVCLTALAAVEAGPVRFFVSAETLGCTTLGALALGCRVNLERAVTPSTRLSGHIVQGHVDAMARYKGHTTEGEGRRVVFEVPASLRRYMVEKGSVALDGISLTLNTLGEEQDGVFEIGLMIIPHTWTHTTLGTLSNGESVNVEVDVIAKYVEAQCRTK
ncbi:riboflavin synthase [Acetobacter papayae]|uniref:riboflavin synthase n=1 Tax=Acetobacter papayae TaxID=1076592 RepID=UPI000471BE8E|nr:riboflavin synthase [Acetobacter papayae]